MKVCKGVSASPGLVLGQVSRLERHVETFSTGPFRPGAGAAPAGRCGAHGAERAGLHGGAGRSTEQAILQFQSMMLDDEGMMNEVRFCIKAGISAAAAMDQGGAALRRPAGQHEGQPLHAAAQRGHSGRHPAG